MLMEDLTKEHLRIIICIGCQLNDSDDDLLNLGFYTDAFKIHQLFTRYFELPKERVSIFAPNEFNQIWIKAFNGKPKIQYEKLFLEVPIEQINVEPEIIPELASGDVRKYNFLSSIATNENDDILLFFFDHGDGHTLVSDENKTWYQSIIQSLSEMKYHTLTVFFEAYSSDNFVTLLEANNNISEALKELNISFEDFSNNFYPLILYERSCRSIDDLKNISNIINRLDMEGMEATYNDYLTQFVIQDKYTNLFDLLTYISELFEYSLRTLNKINISTKDVVELFQPLMELTDSKLSSSPEFASIKEFVESPKQLQLLLTYLEQTKVQNYQEFFLLKHLVDIILSNGNGVKSIKCFENNIFHFKCFSNVNFNIIEQLSKYSETHPRLVKSLNIFSNTHNKSEQTNSICRPVFVDHVIAVSSSNEHFPALTYPTFCTDTGCKIRLGSIGVDSFLKCYITCINRTKLDTMCWRMNMGININLLRKHQKWPGRVYSFNSEFPHFNKFSPYSNKFYKCKYILIEFLEWSIAGSIDDYPKPTSHDDNIPINSSLIPKDSCEAKDEQRVLIVKGSKFEYSPFPAIDDDSIMARVVSIIDHMNEALKPLGLFYDPFSQSAEYSLYLFRTSKSDLQEVFDLYQDANGQFMVSQNVFFIVMAHSLANFIRINRRYRTIIKKALINASHELFGESEFGCFTVDRYLSIQSDV